MEFVKMRVFGSALTTSLIVAAFTALLMTTSAPALSVVARPGSPGTYEIDIYGDASGVHGICEAVHHFKASNLEWSTSFPSYPSGSVDFGLNVRNVDFDKVSAWTYHLSLRGMDEGSIIALGSMSYILSVKARSGELDFIFSNPSTYYPYYYRTVDIEGTLKGDVLFHIDIPPHIPGFNYEGRELTIDVHIGM